MAITLGGTVTAFAAASSTSLTTGNLSSTPVSGSLILVRVSTGDTNNGATSVTDNVAGSPNTFSLIPGSNFYNNGYRVEFWQCTNITGGAGYQVTANWAAGIVERHLTVVEVKGAATSSAIDLVGGQALTSPGTGTNAVTTGSLGTPSTDGQFVLAAFGVDNGVITPSVGTGYTIIGSWDPFGTSGQFLAEYQIQTTAAAVAGTFTTDTGTEAWVVAAVTVKPAASGTNLYFLDSAASGSNFGQLQVGGSAPSTATTATGWTVDTVASGNYALMAYASERASTNFSGTAQPAGNPDNSLGDCFRSTSTMSGDFATGVWTIAVPVIAVSAAAGQDGRVRVRLWRSTSATGASATEITSGAVAGTTVTNLTTGAEQVSTVTTSSITGFSMTAEYLFVQIAWEITGAAA